MRSVHSDGILPGNDEEGEGLIRSKDVEVDPDMRVIQLMQSKLSGLPKLLTQLARGSLKSEIFRVPRELLGTNSEADARPYQPRAFSIGPYHHGKPHLKEMQEYKWRFLEILIQRTIEEKGVGLAHYTKAVRGLEAQARECYSEAINLSSDEFVEMMVLDGCFVLEIFRVNSCAVGTDHPLTSIAELIRGRFQQDFFCLENQIPYILLQTLFTLTQTDSDRLPEGRLDPLANMALYFFYRHPEDVPRGVFERDFKVLHLLNLLRKSFSLPPGMQLLGIHLLVGRVVPASKVTNFYDLESIQSISKLRRAGIKLKLQAERSSFLEVTFERGVISMPLLVLDDNMCDILQNCVAFEVCYPQMVNCFMSEYARFLSCLILTREDVAILCEAKVLRNHYGTAGAVAAFVSKLRMAALSNYQGPRPPSYLWQVYGGVNDYNDNNLHIYLAEVKHKYFSSPWSLISLLAAFFLLLLTVLQTIFAILDYKKKT
ncbi:unnamed protein product [Cuscuta epithymum]|uniref:Uncharacterized protein n=1 Tax=Cuscuta epithymum TaxID=186058 RepID=A0AAV0FVC9_9ASTE|nr:unnamed protein product [Cuscuta epithymum]